MFVPIKKILAPVSERIGFKGSIEIYAIKKKWPQIKKTLLKGREGKLEPLYFRNGILTISCSGSVWANEMRLRQNYILKKINEFLKEEKVKELKFVF